MERKKYKNKIREGLAWEDQNTWESSPWALSSTSAGIPPSPNQVSILPNSICALSHTSGYSHLPSSYTSLPNDQEGSLIQKKPVSWLLPRYL